MFAYDFMINAFIAAGIAAWEARLVEVLADPGVRARMGAKAREWLVANYNLENYGPRFVAVLRAVAGGRDVRDA